MSQATFVNTILDFFTDGLSSKEQLSLVELFWYFDHKQKTTPSMEEINGALEVNKNISLKREGKNVYFVKADLNEEITSELTNDDLKHAGKKYTKEFWKLYKQLNSKH